MIHDMVRLLSKILGKQYEQPYGTYEASEIKHSSGLGFPECLYQLADQGEIGRAEDMLFEEWTSLILKTVHRFEFVHLFE